MKKKSIVFVCLGNICRSPAAEGVMKNIIRNNNMENFIEVDSAGTIGYHKGENADPRMIRHAKKRGIEITSTARKFNPDIDFEKFDYIVTMDEENNRTILSFDKKNKYRDKIFKMTDFSKEIKASEVPDPYYGGSSGFEFVLDILQDACKELFGKVKSEIEYENSVKNRN